LCDTVGLLAFFPITKRPGPAGYPWAFFVVGLSSGSSEEEGDGNNLEALYALGATAFVFRVTHDGKHSKKVMLLLLVELNAA